VRDKDVLVVGGTAGIGLAVARAYAAAGATVTIGGRRAAGEAVAAEAGCAFVRVDISDEESVRAALEQCWPLDVLVLNAGMAQPPVGLGALDSAAARAVVETNLLGTFWGLKHAGAAMNDGGSIILTSSISALMGTSFEGLYGATKAGASSLARSAAIDLGPRGIRVNAVQPGPTWTDMNPMPEKLIGLMTPLGRKARVEDLVGLYVFLGSDASAHVTGQAITADGGLTAGIGQDMLVALATQAAAA